MDHEIDQLKVFYVTQGEDGRTKREMLGIGKYPLLSALKLSEIYRNMQTGRATDEERSLYGIFTFVNPCDFPEGYGRFWEGMVVQLEELISGRELGADEIIKRLFSEATPPGEMRDLLEKYLQCYHPTSVQETTGPVPAVRLPNPHNEPGSLPA
jgi:hypothetical protein